MNGMFSDAAPAPRFSIVVPTHNRAARLRACLESLACQDYPRALFETIVVDDEGAEPLDGLVDAFTGRMQVRLLRQRRTGPGPARNAGAAIARGMWLAFTDDDCRPAPSWLRALDEALSMGGGVGGRTVNGLAGNCCSAASQSLVTYLYEYFNGGAAPFFASNNLALPRALFLEAGGFDTTVPLFPAEDRDLCDRLAGRGVPLRYAPDALVLHAHALTSAGFCRQHFIYGRAAWRYHRLRAARRGDRVRIEPAAFYWDLVRFPFRTGQPRAWTIAALLSLSQIAGAAGFFWERAFPARQTATTY